MKDKYWWFIVAIVIANLTYGSYYFFTIRKTYAETARIDNYVECQNQGMPDCEQIHHEALKIMERNGEKLREKKLQEK